MKQNYAAKRREHLRRAQEWRRNSVFALSSLLAHVVLVLLLPAMASSAPVKTVLLVELAAKPQVIRMLPPALPAPDVPVADTAPRATPAAGQASAHSTSKPHPAKQPAPAAPAATVQPQAPKAAARPGAKAAPAKSAPGASTSDVKLTPAQPKQPVAPKSEQKTPVESKPAEQQGPANPAPQPQAEPQAPPSSGSKPAEKPSTAPPVNMPKDGPPSAPPAKDAGTGASPASPPGPSGPETAAPSPPPGPSKEELNLLSGYGDTARKRIKSQARNPEAGGGGTVKLEFTVAKSGRLVDVKLVESSGYKLLDNDALEAAEVAFNEAHEIVPFPKGVTVEQWTFFMALKYPLW